VTFLASQHHAPSAATYVPGIDALRAVAVLAVLVYHLRPQMLPGGFAGVDIFFVISGYVVTASLARGRSESFWTYLRQFYLRRVVRIYPALLACLLGTFSLAVLFIPSSWLSTTTWKTGLAAFFGFGNVALVGSSDGYFSPRVEFNAFTHTWSLGVEEQFYLVYPLLVFAWLRLKRSRPLSAMAILTVPCVLSMVYSAWASKAEPEWAFYMLPSRFWELATGGVLFVMLQRSRATQPSEREIGAWLFAGLALIAATFSIASPGLFPFPWAVVPVLGAALCVVAVVRGAHLKSGLGRFFENGPAVYIGRISYSLYLWHWPVYVLFRWTVGLESLVNAGVAVLLAALLAIASYRWVEVPLRKSLPQWTIGRSWVLSKAAGVVVLSTLAGATLVWARPWLSLSIVNRQSTDWIPVVSAADAPDPAASSNQWLAGRRLFVVGDSHAGAYEVLLRAVERQTGASVHNLWQAGCAAAKLTAASSPDCQRFLHGAQARIRREARPGDVVFLPGMRVKRLSDQWVFFDAQAVLASLNTGPALKENAEALLEADEWVGGLQRAGVHIVIEAPKPVLPAPPFRCSDWFNQRNPVCAPGLSIDRAKALALAQPTLNSMRWLQAKYPALMVWDPFPMLCPQEQCQPFDAQSKPLFFDGDHLTAHANRLLTPDFLQMLQKVIPRP
jgi:peptidoglycan/LPS O-acetylase OafA/YrhL